jgi:ribosome-associated protein
MKLRDRNFVPEFSFKTSRSSGAGGQHVNTTETKVELIFNVKASALLSDAEKERAISKLSTYINDKGELRINSSASRSQSTNKEDVIEKFYNLLEKALKKEKKRIPTKIPKAVKEQILKRKKLHSKKKSERRFKSGDFM